MQMEEECKVVTASEIAGAIQEMLRFINGSQQKKKIIEE